MGAVRGQIREVGEAQAAVALKVEHSLQRVLEIQRVAHTLQQGMQSSLDLEVSPPPPPPSTPLCSVPSS